MSTPDVKTKITNILYSLIATALLVTAGIEVYQAGWGSGHWIGRFSVKWAVTLLGFGIFFTALWIGSLAVLWRHGRARDSRRYLLAIRVKLAKPRWTLAAGICLGLAWFFLFSPWGSIFEGPYLRLVFFLAAVGIVGWAITTSEQNLIDGPQLLASFVLVGSVFAFGKLLSQVSDYPFTLYWSEGNRLWDYSLVYRPDLYVIPADKLAESISYPGGRIVLYGLPYLLPNFSIWGLRLWNALLFSLPYAAFGWVAIKLRGAKAAPTIIFALWVFIFLNQGPIWAPLVITAILVAFAWKRPLWLAAALLMLAGYYAAFSRPTWVFAPSIWIVMLIFAQPAFENRGLKKRDLVRAGVLGLAGVAGSFVIIQIFPKLNKLVQSVEIGEGPIVSTFVNEIRYLLTHHSLLWNRLFPNPTLGAGILLALAFASLPLVLILVHLVRSGRLRMNLWQLIVIAGGLSSFLFVGLVASVKVGGGTNLHNLDMYFIALVFMASLAWTAGIGSEIGALMERSRILRKVMILIVAIPAFLPMLGATRLDLPPDEKVEVALRGIQEYVSCAQVHGEVLFMDQRQLLTFGHIKDVTLLPEYEKKILMDEALEGDEEYFAPFYTDLRDARFSLIVADRQFVVQKDGSQSLAEENNLWVKWVTIPLLQEYKSVEIYKLVGVELFMPLNRVYVCP